VDVRTTFGENETVVAHFGQSKTRVQFVASVLNSRKKKKPGLGLLRKCISEFNVSAARQQIREVIPAETKILNFLREKQYLSRSFDFHKTTKLSSSLTGQEVYDMIAFVYRHVEPKFLKKPKDKAEVIKSIIEISKKCYPTVSSAIKKDYLLNPMAQHAKKYTFRFLAELCDYVILVTGRSDSDE